MAEEQDNQLLAPDAEDIPDADEVSRCCYTVDGARELDPATSLQFSRGNQPPRCESAYWRKYAPSAEDLATRAIKASEPGNRRRAEKGQPQWQYIGARTGRAGAIRSIRTERGFVFTVDHVPEADDLAHAHITLVKLDPNGPEPRPADRSEFISALLAAMPLERYGG